MSHEHLMERLRAAIRLPGNLQKSCKFFCRGLDIRVRQIVKVHHGDVFFSGAIPHGLIVSIHLPMKL